MRARDVFASAAGAAAGNPLRTVLLVLAMAIGVAAVVVLTALGDGARRYVIREFTTLGSNLVIVLPGRTATGGINPGSAITSTPRDLTVDDARSLLRLPAVLRVAPISVGTSEVSVGGRLRDTLVVGSTAEFLEVRRFTLAQGRFLPVEDWDRGSPVMVIGARLRTDLFGAEPALGQFVRIGDRRFRNRGLLESAKAQATALLKERHGGEEDVTVITQDAVLATFDRLLGTLTLGVAGIAAISLAVAGILVMNVMLVSVTQRRAEIGLMKALGGSGGTIRLLFLVEAALLSIAGALAGYAIGHAGAWVIRTLYPVLPAYPPDWAVLAALGTALVTGVLFGVMPARRAAALDPVQALARR